MPKLTHRFWVGRIYEQCENWPEHSAEEIADRLLAIPTNERPAAAGSPPMTRTVVDYKKRFQGLTPEEKVTYRYARWPDACESGALPWEAAPALLRLLAHRAEFGPPAISTARWFWRLWVAADDRNAPVDMLAAIASGFTVYEQVSGAVPRALFDATQWYLAFKDWTDAGKNEHRRLLNLHPDAFPEPDIFEDLEFIEFSSEQAELVAKAFVLAGLDREGRNRSVLEGVFP